MKIVNLLLSAAMASTMLFQGAAFDAQAAEGVSAEVSDDGAVIGNGYLTRSFQIEDGHLRTESLHNRRIDRTLVPQIRRFCDRDAGRASGGRGHSDTGAEPRRLARRSDGHGQ